jgi:hypothetical protein
VTGRVRLEDLPPAVRARVAAQVVEKSKRSRGSTGTKRGGTWRCSACGVLFSVWAAVERHCDAEHGGSARIEVVIALDNNQEEHRW